MVPSLRFLAVAVVLALLAAPAAAAPSTGPDARTPRYINLRARVDQPGDHYRFVSETVAVREGESAGRQTNRMVFDIEVLAVSDERRLLRYTLREATVEDDSQPGVQLVMNALIGIPVEVETYPGYEPWRLTDWPAVRARLFAALDRTPDLPPATRKGLAEYYDHYETDPGQLAKKVLGDLRILAGMQVPAAPMGQMDLPGESTPLPEGGAVKATASIDLDRVDEARCEVTFSRDTLRETVGASLAYSMHLRTTANVSSHDGWVLTLMEVETIVSDNGKSVETVTIRRQGPPPLCGEI